MVAVVPTLKVEISFVSAPLATSPTWVDVSAYVRQSPGVSIRRGRQSEGQASEAGSAYVTLSNRDRRFDPSYSSGPYFGNLLPRKQIRISATWSAVDYVLFQGHITGWPQSLAAPAGKDSTVTIEAIDGIGWLSGNKVPNDLVYSYANTTIGSLAFFLRGADTSRWSDATNNGYFANLQTGTGAVGSTLAAGSTSPAVQMDGTTKWQGKPFTSSGAWSLSFWFQTTSTSATALVMGGGSGGTGGSTSGPYSSVRTANDGLSINVQIGSGSSGMLGGATVTTPINTGTPHHFVVTCDGSTVGNTKAYVDGVDKTSTFTGSIFPLVLDTFGASAFEATDYWAGSLQDVAVFNKQLSAAEVLAFYQRSYGYLEESSATRVTRLLDDVGWPASWRAVTTTSRATVGQLVYNAKSALTLLQEVERTEQGYVFCSRDNNLTFLSRYYLAEDTTGKTAQQIFDDVGTGTSIPYSTFGFRYDDIDVTNDVTVTTPTTWAKASDATSITNYGWQSRKIDTILSKFTDADSMARGLVARGKTATWRVAPIMAFPARNTTRWANVLALDLAQRVTIKNTPMAIGSQNSQDVSIDSIEWLIESGSWAVTIAGSPTRDVWFIVDDAASLVDGTRVIGY